jgi:hypothetical protein
MGSLFVLLLLGILLQCGRRRELWVARRMQRFQASLHCGRVGFASGTWSLRGTARLVVLLVVLVVLLIVLHVVPFFLTPGQACLPVALSCVLERRSF